VTRFSCVLQSEKQGAGNVGFQRVGASAEAGPAARAATAVGTKWCNCAGLAPQLLAYARAAELAWRAAALQPRFAGRKRSKIVMEQSGPLQVLLALPWYIHGCSMESSGSIRPFRQLSKNERWPSISRVKKRPRST
jgi:hypothetical protein